MTVSPSPVPTTRAAWRKKLRLLRSFGGCLSLMLLPFLIDLTLLDLT